MGKSPEGQVSFTEDISPSTLKQKALTALRQAELFVDLPEKDRAEIETVVTQTIEDKFSGCTLCAEEVLPAFNYIATGIAIATLASHCHQKLDRKIEQQIPNPRPDVHAWPLG